MLWIQNTCGRTVFTHVSERIDAVVCNFCMVKESDSSLTDVSQSRALRAVSITGTCNQLYSFFWGANCNSIRHVFVDSPPDVLLIRSTSMYSIIINQARMAGRAIARTTAVGCARFAVFCHHTDCMWRNRKLPFSTEYRYRTGTTIKTGPMDSTNTIT